MAYETGMRLESQENKENFKGNKLLVKKPAWLLVWSQAGYGELSDIHGLAGTWDVDMGQCLAYPLGRGRRRRTPKPTHIWLLGL